MVGCVNKSAAASPNVFWRWAYGVLIAWLLIGWRLAAGAEPVASAYLDLAGQVVAPAVSPTLGSIRDLSGKDEVRWTSYFQSQLSVPYVLNGQHSLPSGHTWLQGQLKTPPRTSLKWTVGGVDTSTEPASGVVVSDVKWEFTPMATFVGGNIGSTVDFSGTGDGFRIIPYKDKLFVINHHIGGTNFNCRLAKTGAECPGFAHSGLRFSGTSGTVLDVNGGNYEAPHTPLEAVNYATGELFVALHNTSTDQVEVLCTQLDSLTSCGAFSYGNVALQGREHLDSETNVNFDTIGSKYYFLLNDGNLKCFDITTKQACPGLQFPLPDSDRRTIYYTSIALGQQLFFASASKLWCFDAANNKICSGNWNVDGFSTAGGVFPVLLPDGSYRGVCDSNGSNCRDLNGFAMTISANAQAFIANNPFRTKSAWGGGVHAYSVHAAGIYKSRVFNGPSGGAGVNCFDFALDAVCPGFPVKTDVSYDGYSSRMDPVRPRCLLHLGDAAKGLLLDVETLGSCADGADISGATVLMVKPADYYPCDNGRARVKGWDKIRISPSVAWGSGGGLDSVKVNLYDAAGFALPAALKPVRYFTKGQYELDISDIPYTTYPQLKVVIKMSSLTDSIVIDKLLGLDVTWQGDPYQLCVQTKVPDTPYCETAALETLKGRGAHEDVATVREQASATKVMTPGNSQKGYAAVTTATTLRGLSTNLSATEEKTLVLQGRYDWSHFAGDVWGYTVDSAGQLQSSVSVKSSQTLAAPTSRTFYTSRPDTAANVPGSAQLQPMVWANLSATQQQQLNTSLQGLSDGLGPQRLEHFRGVDGSLRPHQGYVLGPVVNSGPMVLAPRAVTGLSDALHPGYLNYRFMVGRSHPLALYGGNDGALHALEVSGGQLNEVWAFVPDVMLRQASRLTDTSLLDVRRNPYAVDNLPMVGHANTGSDSAPDWRAVAVITYGRGARGITAIDVSQRDLSKGKGVIFDYTPQSRAGASDPGELKDLGYVISTPTWTEVLGSQHIVKLNDGRWAVLIGNGVDSHASTSLDGDNHGPGRAVLYAFYLDSAMPRWRRWAVDELLAGSKDAATLATLMTQNGLSAPRAVDLNGDGKVDIAYAGDVQGNLWRFDLRNVGAVTLSQLFKTEGPTQPIYQAPLVVKHQGTSACGPLEAVNCWQVLFGTGAYLSPLVGTANHAQQKLFSILDKGAGGMVQVADLSERSFAELKGASGIDYRATLGDRVDYAHGKLGWVMALGRDEHLVGPPRLQPTGQVAFAVVKPVTAGASATSCSAARSWLFDMQPQTADSVFDTFDTNGDLRTDARDRLSVGSDPVPRPASAMAIGGMQFNVPSVLHSADSRHTAFGMLLPSLGQSVSDSASYSSPGLNGSGSTDGSGASLVVHGHQYRVGRMTWREVFD